MINQNPERSQNYFYLIEQLLRSPQGQYQSILEDNSELLDTGLIEMMRQRAEAEKNMGNIQNAELLNSIADRLNETLPSSFSSNLDKGNKQNIESSSSDDFNQPETKQKNSELPEAQKRALQQLSSGEAFYKKYSNRVGNELVNLNEAIKFFEQGFAILSYENFDDWAIYQNQLGICYLKRGLIRGNYNDIEKAINTYKSALKVFPENKLNWAMIQRSLGNAYLERPGEPLENLNQAIECYQKSLIVYKQDTSSIEYAMANMSLGMAYHKRSILGHSGSAEDIEQSIEYHKKALEVYKDPSKDPEKLARLQFNLGVAYSDRRQGNYAENLELGINYLNQSLTVYTKEAYPDKWALAHMTLGAIYGERKQGGRGDRETNLRLGIECLEKALQVFNPENYRFNWMKTQHNLTASYKLLGSLTKDGKDFKKAIAYGTNIVNKCQGDPQRLAKIQFELGTCYKNLALEGEEREKNLTLAIKCYQDALRVIFR
ncbi:MAG: tetratricopeptide repeat protein, partial [Okeania sp. SIO2H7]|nr:tetratricopeptide repeat protein [Okeania sp. SIO2H7]